MSEIIIEKERKSRLTSGMFSSTTDLWTTPQAFFDELDHEFRFTLDPCANHENHKCRKYFTPEDNGLAQDWQGHTVFCNPPYGRAIGEWVKKCHDEAQKPNTKVVMLIPARTDTSYFHEYIYNQAELRFIRGRLHFNESPQGAPFPSMVVVFNYKPKYEKVGEVCGDNRFETIDAAKKDLLDSTNIDTSPDEMKVLDNFLFRCWQMGWLDKYEKGGDQ